MLGGGGGARKGKRQKVKKKKGLFCIALLLIHTGHGLPRE
jgi:hypothetical protein